MTLTGHNKSKVRAIAFYLPQFYPTPENDVWWGKGFTEWTNVVKAKPLFPGHYQPRLPADLGFYDLRVPETRAAQAELAQAHGIEGFCYWHYWFEGRRILDRPFNDVLQSGEPDFPFCLGWANHTWSRRWTGSDDDILIKQTYSPEDDINHARWLTQAFADERYIRVGERPLFLIYNPYHLPNAQKTTDTIRAECARQGIPDPYLVGLNLLNPNVDPRTLGFDGTISHQPQFGPLWMYVQDTRSERRLLRNMMKYRVLDERLKIIDYKIAAKSMSESGLSYPAWPCVVVDWDTTARRGRKAIVFADASPELFEKHLTDVIGNQMSYQAEERFVFLNAWNEWGEGMYLEPDTKFGMRYLESVKKAVCQPMLLDTPPVGVS